MHQKTIVGEASWEGIGLHTGQHCAVTMKPATPGFGIKFKRSDIEGSRWIAADTKYVVSTQRSTNLGVGDLIIGTVEHLLAAIYGAGIDNAEIHVSGPEIPILDGSAIDFFKKIDDLPADAQDRDRQPLVIREVVHYNDEESGAEYTAIPSDHLSIECVIDFDSELIGQRYASYDIRDDFGNTLADARTFVFTDDVVALAEAGLIKGGGIDNAIVLKNKTASDEDLTRALQLIGKDNVDSIVAKVNNGFDLKYDNELARHKILDLLGDLALIGAPIQAKIIAKKPGHSGNVGFATLLKQIYQKQVRLKDMPIYDARKEPIFDVERLKTYLPHRYPFLMIDRIIELSDTHVVGVKNVTFNENFFQGHFPGNSIFPGVLQMEALAQTGGVLALSTVDNPSNHDTYFMKMDNVKFKKKVVPGDTLLLKMQLVSPIRRGIFHMKGTVYVGDQIVSEGELTAQIVDRTLVK